MPCRSYFEDAFLELLAEHGEVKIAAERSGVVRATVYYRMRVDPSFRDLCQQAIEKRRAGVLKQARAANRRANLSGY